MIDFGDGAPFTLESEKRTSSWIGAGRVIGGGAGLALSGEIGAEEQQEEMSVGRPPRPPVHLLVGTKAHRVRAL